MVLTGEAGMGKTRLRRASPPRRTPAAAPSCTGASTRRRSCPTSRSWRRCATTPPRGRPSARDRRRGARAARARARRHGAAPEPGERENRRYRLFEAVAALLGRAAGERPVLLVVEDLQWAGRPTLLLLRHVVRRLHGRAADGARHAARRGGRPGRPPARLLADLSREHVVERDRARGARRRPRRPSWSATPSSPRRLHGPHRRQPVLHRGDAAQPRRGARRAARRARGRQGPRLAAARAAGARRPSRR